MDEERLDHLDRRDAHRLGEFLDGDRLPELDPGAGAELPGDRLAEPGGELAVEPLDHLRGLGGGLAVPPPGPPSGAGPARLLGEGRGPAERRRRGADAGRGRPAHRAHDRRDDLPVGRARTELVAAGGRGDARGLDATGTRRRGWARSRGRGPGGDPGRCRRSGGAGLRPRLGPRLRARFRPRLGARFRPRLGARLRPRLGAGLRSRLRPGLRPRLGAGLRPRFPRESRFGIHPPGPLGFDGRGLRGRAFGGSLRGRRPGRLFRGGPGLRAFGGFARGLFPGFARRLLPGRPRGLLPGLSLRELRRFASPALRFLPGLLLGCLARLHRGGGAGAGLGRLAEPLLFGRPADPLLGLGLRIGSLGAARLEPQPVPDLPGVAVRDG